MLKDRTIARIVGVLFFTTVIAGMIESSIVLPLLSTPLPNVAAHTNTIVLGVFLTLYMSVGVVIIALLMFPILKRHSSLIATTYLTFRAIESVFLIVAALVSLFVVSLASGPLASLDSAPHMASLAVKARMDSYQIAMTILGLNSIAMCSLMLKSRLVPAWISATGIVGYALLFASAALSLCGIVDTNGTGALLYIPGGLFELVLFPVWLVAKGFRPTPHAIGVSAQ